MINKTILLFLLFWATTSLLLGQRYDPERVCSSDTLTGFRSMSYYDTSSALFHLKKRQWRGRPFQFIICEEVSPVALRVDLGISTFINEPMLRDWLGNHNSYLYGLSVTKHEWSFGFRYKRSSLLTNHAIDNYTLILPEQSKFSSAKTDYYCSYAFNIGQRFTIEPSLGVTRNDFEVVEPGLKELKWEFNPVFGALAGIALNQYIRLNKTNYLVIWGQVNGTTSNYQHTHPSFGRGYIEFSAGIGYKIFGKRYPVVAIRD
jgi:hypothetical protein